jgi:hypothetical protein
MSALPSLSPNNGLALDAIDEVHPRFGPSLDWRQSTERASVAQSSPVAQCRGVQGPRGARWRRCHRRGRAIDLRQNPQLVLPGEGPPARPIRQFGSRRCWGCHGGRPWASPRVSPSGAIKFQVSVWHNHVISILRPRLSSSNSDVS